MEYSLAYVLDNVSVYGMVGMNSKIRTVRSPFWPQEGEIWPNSQAEVSVIFQPNGARAYSSDIYCDVTGRESRLLLKVRGEGLGPQCVFSFDALDIQNVFVSSEHSYEVVMENKGDIEAEYSLVKPDSLFGPKFSFDPSKGVLYPGQLQVIQVVSC